MKLFLTILFILDLITLGIGFYLKNGDKETGDLFIGISIIVGFFILMPLFIYHRWKNKSVKDYMLTKENIKKMRNYQEDNKI